MNRLEIPSAVDHFEAAINKAFNYQSSIPGSILYVSLFMLRLGTHSKALQLDICLKYITFATCAYKSKDCLISWRKKPRAMPTLLDLLTEQLSTDSTQALASSSLAVMHLKTLQMQSDDPINGILRIKLTYLFPCLGE